MPIANWVMYLIASVVIFGGLGWCLTLVGSRKDVEAMTDEEVKKLQDSI